MPTTAQTIENTAAWQQLNAHSEQARGWHLRDLFHQDVGRFDKFSLRWNGWLLDYSKQRIDNETLKRLIALWHAAAVPQWCAKMRHGELVNATEGRAALHIALRQPQGVLLQHGRDVVRDVRAVLDKMERFVRAVHTGAWPGATGETISDVVNIGIGGSDLGPRMATQALSAFRQDAINLHFVANLDGADLATKLAQLDPKRTLFIVASKTFTTQETMQNARSARAWLTSALNEAAVARHFVAVSTNLTEVAHFGINPDHIFEFWDWVGGRYSLWSAIGLPLMLAVGADHFRALLAGAHQMDEHFFSAPPERNLPAILALLQVWNTNFLGAPTRALLPYSESLGLLPRYLQQLEMESNGKQVSRNGVPLTIDTAPILWGEPGTNGQHAFYQLIHQGGRLIPCEFIAVREADYPLPGHQAKLLANCFAQSEALMRGKTREEALAEMSKLPATVANRLAPYKVFPGNQPSTTLLLPRLDPFNLGALIALYEHKVFVEAAIWGINPFDQWGVEYGKQLANRLLPMLEGRTAVQGLDCSTAGLIRAVGAAA